MSRIRSCTFAIAAFLLGLPLVASADTFNGILSVVWGDPRFAGSAGQVTYTLATPDGRYMPLSVQDGTAILGFRGKSVVVTGQLAAPRAQARGTGLAPEPAIVVESMALDPSASAAATVHGGPSATVSGTKKVIFVLVKFSDDVASADPHPASFFDALTNPDTGSGSIPATINGFFKKTSNNLLQWDGDTAGVGGVGGTTWIPLPHDKNYYAPCGWSGSCFGGSNTNFTNFTNDAVNAAKAQGVNFALYDNINFVISNDLDCCAWGGDWVVDGKAFGTTWEPPWGQETRVYSHEMGHSIGLPHSGWLYHDYDSPWDVMSGYSDVVSTSCGSYFSRNDAATQSISCSEPGNGYIMAHRDFLGWIAAANQLSVPAFGSANVTLEGGSLPVGSALKMIKICLPGVPCTGTGSTTRYFTVEARVKDATSTTLFDHGIPNEGIIIHDVWFGRPAIGGAGTCYFNNQSGWAVPVDANPGDYTGYPTCSPPYTTALDNAQFVAGQTYTNATHKFKVTVVSRTGNTFKILVQSTVGGAIGDFDGEALSEATVYTSSGQWRILKSSTGYASFDTVVRGGVGFLPLQADFDGDGRLDPATYQPATGAWRAAKSSTNYTTLFALDWGGPVYQPVPGDYDGDGKTDPALYKRATGQWSVLKSSTSFATSINVTWGGPAQTAVPGQDFDGDGKDDIVTYQESTGSWRILKSSTDFTTSQVVGFGGPGFTLVAGDYDGDGKADPAVYNRTTGLWSVLRSSASYGTSFSIGYGGAGYDPVPADFDGDGRIDLAVVQRSTGNWSILKSSTSYASSLPTIPGWGGAADAIISNAIVPGGYNKADMRATDFDVDGKSDMTLYQASTQTWYSLTSASNFMSSITRVWGAAGATPFSDDYDGDGKTDYAKYTQSTGAWEILLSSNGTTLTRTLGGPGYVPISVDFDGDGKADIGAFNQSTGNWLALKSSTNFNTSFSINWATGSAFAIAPGDFDGDGKTDLGSYRASTATWHILLSGMNYTTSLGGLPAFGGSGWIPVQADYDGDGKTDPMIYNPTTGGWYGLKSGSNYTTSLSVGWGGSGFVPIRGDMDGDGKIDLALQQTASANWYVLLSSTNYTTSIARGWGGAGFVPIPIY